MTVVGSGSSVVEGGTNNIIGFVRREYMQTRENYLMEGVVVVSIERFWV